MTLTPNGSPFYLQIGGVWVHLDGVSPVVPITSDRPSSEFVSLGGVRRTQRAASAPRTWAIGAEEVDAEFVRWLSLAASGLAGDVWLYDQAAAQANMLNPLDTIGRDTAQPLVTVDSVPLRSFAASYTLTRKVRQGVMYWLGGWSTQTAAATLGTYNLGAGAVNIGAPAGTGSRRFSTSFTPAADATVTIIITVAAKTSGLRLTEGSVDSLGFLPGENTPCQVSVSDPDRSLSMVYTDRLPQSDYSVVLREVG